MSIQAFLNEFDKRLYKMKSYGTVQSDDKLAYDLLKSDHLSNNHKELIKVTIPELKYDLIKDQVKKTISDVSRRIPRKNENVIKAEDTFLTEDFSQMTIEERYNTKLEYNSFRSTNIQQTYDQELDTYYNRGNYRNYNRRNNISRHYQKQPKVRSTQSNMKQIQQTHQQKNQCGRNGIKLRCHICESIYHMAQNNQEINDTLYTQEVVRY